MIYHNIEKFYEQNHHLLLEDNGRRSLRPTKSYTKDIIACFLKFKELYLKEGLIAHTKEDFSNILNVDANTTLQNLRSMQEFGFLNGDLDYGDEDENNESVEVAEATFSLTSNFIKLVESEADFGSYLYDRISKIQTLDDITPYLNYLLCTLREAAEFGNVISFGPISDEKYKSIVKSPDDRQTLRDRIYSIYGYTGRRSPTRNVYSDDYIPNISYMSFGVLEDLGLLKKDKNKNKFNLNTLSLTYPGKYLLSELDKHIGKAKNKEHKIHMSINKENMVSLQPYLNALRTKPFMILAGISGTGKSRIVRELAFKCCPKHLQDKDGTTPGNYCMVEVKPNWHDSTELLGYWSNLHDKYIFTKFVKFLVKAKMYPNVPFFVCLDEMNLAPVEQYFAEFLSILETRRIVKDEEDEKENTEVKTGALVDKDNFISFGAIGDKHLENNRQIYFKLFNINDREMMEKVVDSSKSLLKDGLTLPENVFVVGTVNMDDTTHQFSRKVIDRAMTIEMNGGALEDIFNNDGDLKYTDEPLTMDNLRSKYVTANDVIEKCSTIAADEQICKFIKGSTENGLPQRLQAINTVLTGTPFTVSYRVMNELTIYLAVLLDKAEEEGKDVNFDTFMPYVETAIDKILLMKILPRVEGDDEMFRISEKERRINELDSQVNDEDGMSHEFTKLDWLKQIAPQHPNEGKKGYMAVDKLSEMIDRLNRQSFTRYWP